MGAITICIPIEPLCRVSCNALQPNKEVVQSCARRLSAKGEGIGENSHFASKSFNDPHLFVNF
jgi:hypothetical protein